MADRPNIRQVVDVADRAISMACTFAEGDNRRALTVASQVMSEVRMFAFLYSADPAAASQRFAEFMQTIPNE